MIEINPTSQRRTSKNKIKSKKDTGAVSKNTTDFASQLNNNITVDCQGSIEEILNDLKEREQQFLDQQTHYELVQYKNTVQKLLKLILDEGFKTKNLKRTRRDRADFTIIGEINSKLLEMSTAVTRSNKAFNLLKTIEEIRGLLLDLVY